MSLLKKIFNKFNYEKRTEYLALYSSILNGLIAIAKIILAYVFKDSGGGFFAVSGLVNIFMLLAKAECFKGMRFNDPNDFKRRNFVVSLFLFISGIIYILYMGRLFFYDTMHIDYPFWLNIVIACVAFVEIILSVRGLFTVRGRGHFYRNIKVINLAGALLAMALTQIVLLSATHDGVANNVVDGITGVSVGGFILILAIFIWISPKISILDKSIREYKKLDGALELTSTTLIHNNKIYGRYVFVITERTENTITGKIVREKSDLNNLKWYYKIPLYIFSIVLIIPFILGATIHYFLGARLPKKTDEVLRKKGYRHLL